MHGSRITHAVLALTLGARSVLAQTEERPDSVPPAEADPAPAAMTGDRSVVVVAPPDHPTLPLLRAELQALELTIQETAAADAPSASRFRVVLGEGQIEVWVHDPQTHRTILREVFTQADSSPVERLTAVLHTVELLRTQLNAPAPAPPPPEPAPEPPPPPPANQSGWLLSAVPQLLYSPGGTTVGAAVELDVMRHWSKIGVRGLVAASALPNRQESSEGTAEARPRFAGIQGVWVANREGSHLDASAGAGVVLLGTQLTAKPEAGYRAERDHLLTVAPMLDLRAATLLGRHVGIVATGAVLTPLRSDRIVFGGREVARYGEVLVTGGLGLQLRLP